ncbi:MAG: OmpA family protein [Labilithrix sp.]|nr:OmpA family protein [Labilithrix sp.]MCW5811838.1 OmpA family protein [Labilithrix sp.]
MAPRRFFALMFVTSGVLAATPAIAQEQPGYASNHFNPSERGSRWFALDSLDLKGDGRLALGLVNDYSYRSVAGYEPDGDVAGSVVRNQYYAHLGAAVNLADRFRLALNVPLQVFADGHTATIGGRVHRPARDVAVGDIRFSGDVRIFGEHNDAATLALGAEFYFPSGSESAYTGDGKPRFSPRVLFAGRTSAIAYAARAGFQFRGRDEAWGDGYIGNNVFYGASVGALLADDKLVVGPELFGSTVVVNDRAFEKRTTPLELLLGVHYEVGENIRLGAGVGTALVRGYGAPVARGLLSLEWVPGNAKPDAPAKPTDDRDGDGIPDCEDACGFTPGNKTDDPNTNGCPPADADRDGIPDAADACPLVPGQASPDAKANGCPADSDHDGVPDAEDACPTEAGKRSSDPKRNGCPDRDSDGDGVLDAEDACPTAAGVKTTDPKTNGCPDPDRDKDGIPNDADACPDQPGKADPDPKKNGCPKAFLDHGVIKITEQVRFKTGSAEILGKESDEVLGAVLDVLKQNTKITKVRVEGHTDNKGDAQQNKNLSKARAGSVVAWLAAHGIDKGRLAADGFGAEKPIATNDTDEGRTANRRVEFHVEEEQAGGSGR